MNWDTVKGKWTEIKGHAQKKWGEITDDEWDEIQGERDILVGKVQQRYGTTKEEAEREVDEWSKSV